jgi:L-rhamnose-H+ transport protein
MLYLHKKNHSFSLYRAPGSLRNIGFTIIMGVFWFGSVALYSESSQLIGELGPVIAWPLFMVLIILTSNFWGWRHNEWEGCPASVQRQALLSIAALVVAVLILAYSATLSK